MGNRHARNGSLEKSKRLQMGNESETRGTTQKAMRDGKLRSQPFGSGGVGPSQSRYGRRDERLNEISFCISRGIDYGSQSGQQLAQSVGLLSLHPHDDPSLRQPSSGRVVFQTLSHSGRNALSCGGRHCLACVLTQLVHRQPQKPGTTNRQQSATSVAAVGQRGIQGVKSSGVARLAQKRGQNTQM